ncbi:hypothetical protein AVEN_229-1 [Araneus ventricosus]|uniref:Helitron helicase-like domain-containing protein n=1 Tax=Araneus ventricosus TaxID=182803 RepID=A0A4Y1ZQY7_ARAVE|nr:hypothetical protein AVEN_229-1 [Araneus ventricosus]
MTAEETEELRSDDQLRAIARRNNESFEVRNQRQASDRLRTLNSSTTESNEQRERRIHCNTLGNQNRIGFDELLKLDPRHQDCAVPIWKGFFTRTPSITRTIEEFDVRESYKSKEFLSMIRKYNRSFQTTSFGTSLSMLDSTVFMPTFRIQGQVYHKSRSLTNEEAKFFQIYFLGNEEAEAKRRCKLIPMTTKRLIESLQKMLHENNH